MKIKKVYSNPLLIASLIYATISLGNNDDEGNKTIPFTAGEITQITDYEYNSELNSFALEDYDMMCERIPITRSPWWKQLALRGYDLWYAYYTFWTAALVAQYTDIRKKIEALSYYFLQKRTKKSLEKMEGEK